MIRSILTGAGRLAGATALLAALTAQPAQAQIWTDWQAMVFNSTLGSATGTIGFSATDIVGVSYTGQVASPSQTTCGTPYFAASWPAYSGVVAPPLPCDMIALTGASTVPSLHTLVFSAPLIDPFFAIVSMGQRAIPVDYAFNAPFTIIDEGQGHWGDGTLTDLGGNVLQGAEGHGILQFSGTFTSLSWNASPSEFWHGFTVGARAPGTSVTPEPLSIALLGTGLLGIAGVARRRRRRDETAD